MDFFIRFINSNLYDVIGVSDLIISMGSQNYSIITVIIIITIIIITIIITTVTIIIATVTIIIIVVN
jgi:hypothetical protein